MLSTTCWCSCSHRGYLFANVLVTARIYESTKNLQQRSKKKGDRTAPTRSSRIFSAATVAEKSLVETYKLQH